MGSRAFTGDVKAIRIYNRTLTADELKANAATDTYRYGDIDYEKLAQESWDNVIGDTGLLDKNTTLAGVPAYATSQLAPPGAVEVSVADKGNGAFEFTYKVAGGDKVLNTHTLYVDTEYTLDMSKMTADEQAKLLNDIVKYAGSGTIAVKWDDTAKALNYKGTRNGNPVSHLYFPVYASEGSYVFEAEIGFVSGATTWSTMAFAAEGFVEHLQSAFWGTLSKTGTGAEFVRFQDPAVYGDNWAVGHVNVPFTTVLDALGDKWSDTYTYNAEKDTYSVTDTVTFKVIVYEDTMYGFVDGAQVLTVPNSGSLCKDLNGVFGFNSGGSSLNIHSLSVRPITEENEDEELAGVDVRFNPVASFRTDIYEPDTDVNTAPIVMQSATEFVSDVSDLAKRPSAIIFNVKVEGGVLKAYDGDKLLGNFTDLYKANQPKANVGVRVAMGDKATATALAAWAVDNRAGNLWAISADVELLNIITETASTIRGVVDFTGDIVRGPSEIKYNFDTDGDGVVEDKEYADAPNKVIGGEYADMTAPTFTYKEYTGGYEALDLNDVYDIIMTCGYRTVLLPERVVTKDHVYYLQGSLINVIVETEAATELDFYNLIVTGVNGILSTEFDANIAALEGDLFDVNGEELNVRGGSFVGHRGDMGYHVKGAETLPENSIEAIVSAAQSGASSVEFDMYLTLDGELVLNHNASIAGYFEYGPNTPANITRVADNVGITSRYWYGDLEYMVSTYNKNVPMQRLEDLYEAVDTEYPELRLHHEIKDGRIETLNRTIELMDKYGLRGRSDMMCFTRSVVEYTSSMGISTQYLSSVSKYSDSDRPYNMEAQYRSVNSTWHATWGDVTNSPSNTEFLEEMKHFGQTAYPWATYKNTYAQYYVQGYQGFTIDDIHHTDDIIRELIPSFDPDTGKLAVTARTVAYHEPGSAVGKTDMVGDDYVVVTLPDYLQGWWENPQCSHYVSDTPNEYALSGYEVVVVSGDAVVNGDTITATEESVVLVRYKQKLDDQNSFWIYSQTFTVGGEKITGYDVTANADASYDGTAKASATVTEGVPADAEITFSWTDAAGQPQTSTTVPSFTEPGTYEVSYVISKPNYISVTGSYEFTIEETVVADAYQNITCKIYNADGKLVNQVTDSMASYAARAKQNTGDELYEMIMKFATSAHAYLHSK